MARKIRGRKLLRRWRLDQRPPVTQDELGQRLGKDGSHVRHFEAGRVDFSIATAVEVSKLTSIPLSELLTPDNLAVASGAAKLLDSSGDAA